ncbi:MAG TPA: hypothetical protein PK563_14585 [Tenuifilaceae bacterium]|nr:hypothetical protein [Tenuifilaceae bacterium]
MNIVKEKIKREYEEYLKIGYCKQAKELNECIGDEVFFDTHNPHYFTGKLDSKVVAVNLNPKRDKKHRSEKILKNTFDEFWDFYENFGKLKYETPKDKKADSRFDNKQVKFYKGAGLLDLIEEKGHADKFINLKKVIDNKLQWELVPFGSPDFTFSKIGYKNLNPFLSAAIEAVILFPRDYIFFNGAVFRDLLNFENIELVSKHHFKLMKKDGTYTGKDDYEIINIIINGKIKAAILSHYAYFNTPLPDYGRKIIELYHK